MAKTWRAVVGIGAALAAGISCTATKPLARGALGEAVAQAKAPGFTGQILVGNRQQLLFDTTVGMASTPPIWTWGSVSKQVTAALAMSEVERGTLGLDDPIGRQLPEFPNPATRTVIVRQLLQHTSGLPNPDDLPAGEGAAGFFFAIYNAAQANTHTACERHQNGHRLRPRKYTGASV